MIHTISHYYSHEFKEEDSIVVAYFKTKTGTGYRVYFYPARDYFGDMLNAGFISQNGYYFGFTKIHPNEDKKEPFDARIMNTINNIVNEFYESEGVKSILIFHCSGDWGDDKKVKRARRFDLWFNLVNGKFSFTKYNEEIILNNITEENSNVITDKEYLSIIVESTNPDIGIILDEFQEIKNIFIAGKGE